MSGIFKDSFVILLFVKNQKKTVTDYISWKCRDRAESWAVVVRSKFARDVIYLSVFAWEKLLLLFIIIILFFWKLWIFAFVWSIQEKERGGLALAPAPGTEFRKSDFISFHNYRMAKCLSNIIHGWLNFVIPNYFIVVNFCASK